MTPVGKSGFKIDKKILLNARNYLLSKKRTEDEERELVFLNLFIQNSIGLTSSLLTNEEFRQNYLRDARCLTGDYYQFLGDIFEFNDFNNDLDDLNTLSYEKIVTNYEEVFASVHDFYKSLDGEWFRLFNNIYKERHSTVDLTDNRSFSVLFPETNIWLANIEATGTIEDYVNVTHEYAHGIDDLIHKSIRTYSPDNIFLELFPIVCQILFLKDNKDIRNQFEVNKYLLNFEINMMSEAEEVQAKYNMINAFPNVGNARNLSRLIKRCWGKTVHKNDLSIIFSNSVVETIYYVYTYLVALELIDTYDKDLDKFKYQMNYLLTTDKAPKDALEYLNIKPNETKRRVRK